MESTNTTPCSEDFRNNVLFDHQNHENLSDLPSADKNIINNTSPDCNGDDLASNPSNRDSILETDTDDKCNSDSVNNLESVLHDSAKDQASVSVGNVANTDTLAEESFNGDSFRNSRADFDAINVNVTNNETIVEDDACNSNLVNVANNVTVIKGVDGTEDSINDHTVSISNTKTAIEDIHHSDNARTIVNTVTATEDVQHSDNARSLENTETAIEVIHHSDYTRSIANTETAMDDIHQSDNVRSIANTETAMEDIHHSDNIRSVEFPDKDKTNCYGSNIEASSLDDYDLNHSTDNINDLEKSSDNKPPDSPASSEADNTKPSSEAEDPFSENEDDAVDKRIPSRRNFSLPYFQLPNPTLDDFVTETDKLLQVPIETNKKSAFVSLPSKPKEKDVIVFDVQEKPPEFIELVVEDAPSEVSCVNNRNSISTEYTKIITSLGKLDESKSPGIKRLALKEFLKKKIEEKKSAAFNRSKELSKLDEEMDSGEEIESDEEKDEMSSDLESLDGMFSEPTVSFGNTDVNPDDAEAQATENDSDIDADQDVDPDHTVAPASENSDDDDDDITFVRKKKLQTLEEYSDDEMVPLDEYPEDKKQINELDEDFYVGSSLPSYQPGGGFTRMPSGSVLESQEESMGKKIQDLNDSHSYDANNVSESQSQASNSYFKDLPDSVEGQSFIRPFSNIDDLPMSNGNGSDMFSTQELEAVCSGAFKANGNKSEAEENMVSEDESELGEHPEQELEDKEYVEENSSLYDEAVSKENKKTLFEENFNEFFDDEAELSGEDDGQEDEPSDGEDVDDLVVIDDKDVPSNEELRDGIADLHMKRVLDDDSELLKVIKERFLDDGELDGVGRTRRFAWKNNDFQNFDQNENNSSDSDEETAFNDTWSSINQEKAKWRQENTEEDLNEDLNSSYKKSLKVNIVNKPKFSHTVGAQDASKRLSGKRPRGSFLNLDDTSASQVLKKLRTSEDNADGSRTTKHFVFRNEHQPSEPASTKKKVSTIRVDISDENASISIEGSVFNNI